MGRCGGGRRVGEEKGGKERSICNCSDFIVFLC